jgi:hypothetical protein
MSSPESLKHTGPERQSSLEALNEERRLQQERLKNNLEKAGEQSHEHDERSARHEAYEAAVSSEKPVDTTERQVSPAERRVHGPSKTEQDASFKTTMTEVRSQMNTPSRTFSKVIHNKTVEKVSEATSNTVARPNALLSGAFFAFVLTLAVYLISKNIGYELSGFESIGAFILGWILGLAYDFIKTMVTGRSS